LSPDLIEAQAFTTGFRGYDQSEVREFLGRVAAEVRAYRERTERLESAWHSAEERAARPPVLDEDTLMAAVGDETATILRAARAAAADLRTRAAAEAERIVADAETQAAQVRSEAEDVMAREMAAAEEAKSRIVESARSDAAEAMEKARSDADAIRASAQQEKALTVEGAMATRERVLEDLSRRRRVASVQIEQLRAGRERLLESYAVVRRTLEEVNDELNRADAEARAAADEVGRRMQRGEQQPELGSATAPAGPETAVHTEFHPEDEPDAGEATSAQPAATESEPPASQPSTPGPTATETAAPVPAAAPPSPPAPPRAAGKRRGRVGAPGATASATAAATAAAPAEAPDDQGHEAAAGADQPVVPHLRVVPDAGEGATHTPTGSGLGSRVDMLFARIRAGRSDKASPAAPTVVDVAPTAVSASDPADALPAAEPGSAAVVAPADEPDAPTATDIEVPSSDGDEALLQRREAALIEIEAALTRKWKRTLQDEQNDLLDRLRSLKSQPTVESLLPEQADHVDRYAAAAQPFVEQSTAAGVNLAAQVLGGDQAHHSAPPAVSDLSEEAATTIVESLRRRLERALSSAAGDEQSVLIEALGAAYREWKSERIERIAGDVLAAAFARGTWHAVPDGTPLRWIVDDTDGPCPDCDDDVLAGSLPKGEAFPTGQPYPPAHPGCRCLLVPVRE
jgi:DivIVA domain-containing protein